MKKSFNTFKVFTICAIMILFAAFGPIYAYANVGDMGFFGGISEGRRLPKTTETLLLQTAKTTNNRNNATSYRYKEMVFLDGEPLEFTGMIDVATNGAVSDTVNLGTYTQTLRVYPTAGSGTTVAVVRNLVFTVNWRRENNQIIKDYTVRNWQESITTPSGTYVLDNRASNFGVSIIEDHNAAAIYYRGDISSHLVYNLADNDVYTLDTTGSFYGYDSAWSKTETHRMDTTLTANDWSMTYQVRPSVTVSKTLQYEKNEPTAISFDGNYKEVMQNKSGLKYDIFVKPQYILDMDMTGGASISTQNTFEQLIAPDLSFLKGHFAESDIKKLFAMQILSGDTKTYQPAQTMSRGQFVTALAKAIKLPITPVQTNTKNAKNTAQTIVFPDVLPTRTEYPYIMAAYKAGLAVGRDNGSFYFDSPLQRQEAIVIMLRALGLDNLALDPTPLTFFTDDEQIGDWAKRDIAAAHAIGIIAPDEEGRIRPTDMVSKADAAAMINLFVEYLRTNIATDYADNIVNITT